MLFLIILACLITIFLMLSKPRKAISIICVILFVLSVICYAAILLIRDNPVVCEDERVDIKITDVENFKVKISGNFATWDDAEGITYIVPKEEIELSTISDDNLEIFKVTKCKKVKYYPDWAKFLLDFGLLGISNNQNSITYEIEVPEKNIVYSNI